MLNLVADFQKNNSLVLNPKFVDGIRSILKDTSLDKVCTILVLIFLFLSKNVVPNVIASMLQEFIAKAITLPGEGEIMDMMDVADPDAVHAVRCFIKKQLALHLKEEFLTAVSFACTLSCEC